MKLTLWRDWQVRTTFRPTTATILHSAVAEWPGARDRGALDIRFAYVVEGVERTTGRFGIAEVPERSQDEARRRAEAFPVGSQHPAWYDPEDPSVAVLSRRIHPAGAIGAFLCILGIVAPLLLGRRIREEAPVASASRID